MRIGLLSGLSCLLCALAAPRAFSQENRDPLLDLMIQKGMLTQDEAQKVRAEADSMRTNTQPQSLPPLQSKWKINNAIKSIELFGDVRLRYEQRQANAPDGGKVELQRGRYAVRLGLRGDVFDDFYYGLRLDTSANPRSPWNTFGTSSSGSPYYGPYGKSTAGINIGQVYIGWRPEDWVDLTVGKMPQPLYTTPMVWDTDFNPEGAAEKFKYQVGAVDFFATFGQFLYQDVNPAEATGGLGFNGFNGQSGDTIFQLAWQAGMNAHITTNLSAKVAPTLYNYVGLQSSSVAYPGAAPYYGDVFVGEGAYTGRGGATVNGQSGYNLGSAASQGSPTYPSYSYPLNQNGLRHLLILEFPWEVNYQMAKLNWRLFGDFSYNLEGAQRAKEAAQAYSTYLGNPNAFNQNLPQTSTLTSFAPQENDVKAYQFGLGVGSGGLAYGPMQGLVYGSTSRKHAWEVRTYWQHVEQYALDPNLLDSDFFEGRGNLEGIYTAVAYGITDNVIGTVRYGYAMRINDKLGTGGSNLDIPQMNAIDHFNLLQLDLTLRF